MKLLITLLILSLLTFGCASVNKNNIGNEYGWVCTTEKIAASSEDRITINGNPNCIRINIDRDPTKNHYLNQWEQEQLPSMPDLP